MSDFEPPKYIEKLIGAVNDGAKAAQLGALAFVAIGLFLLATSFSATDEDLLLGKSIAISQLGGVAVPVALSFGFMPAVFVAVHLYTLIRFELLAGNVRHLLAELSVMVRVEADRVRCRQLLTNVEFVQALAVPGASWVYRWTAWGIIAVFPVMVLVLVQLGSLRLQSYVVNVVHHVAIVADLVLLVWFSLRLRGVVMPGLGDATVGRMRRAWRWVRAMVPVLRRERLLWLPLAIVLSDIAWFRPPTEAARTVGDAVAQGSVSRPPRTPHADEAWPVSVLGMITDPWIQPVDLVLCPYVKLGCRFLSVPGRVLVGKVWDSNSFVQLRAGKELDTERKAGFEPAVLRDRSLLFANLSGSQLFSADLTGSRLQGAALASTSLRGAILAEASLQGANLTGASLQGANLTGASLQGATLRRAHLMNAWMDTNTDMGLVDATHVTFLPLSGEEVLQLINHVPESVRGIMRMQLAPRAAGNRLSPVKTDSGPMLVLDGAAPAWAALRRDQVTTDPAVVARPLAQYLANEVATISTAATDNVAARLLALDCDTLRDALLDPLRDRLLEHVAAGKVSLSPWRIQLLKYQEPSCEGTDTVR